VLIPTTAQAANSKGQAKRVNGSNFES